MPARLTHALAELREEPHPGPGTRPSGKPRTRLTRLSGKPRTPLTRLPGEPRARRGTLRGVRAAGWQQGRDGPEQPGADQQPPGVQDGRQQRRARRRHQGGDAHGQRHRGVGLPPPPGVHDLGRECLERGPARPLPRADHRRRDGHERDRAPEPERDERGGQRGGQPRPRHHGPARVPVGQDPADRHGGEEADGAGGQHDAEPGGGERAVQHGEPQHEGQRPGRQAGGGGAAPQPDELALAQDRPRPRGVPAGHVRSSRRYFANPSRPSMLRGPLMPSL